MGDRLARIQRNVAVLAALRPYERVMIEAVEKPRSTSTETYASRLARAQPPSIDTHYISVDNRSTERDNHAGVIAFIWHVSFQIMALAQETATSSTLDVLGDLLLNAKAGVNQLRTSTHAHRAQLCVDLAELANQLTYDRDRILTLRNSRTT